MNWKKRGMLKSILALRPEGHDVTVVRLTPVYKAQSKSNKSMFDE